MQRAVHSTRANSLDLIPTDVEVIIREQADELTVKLLQGAERGAVGIIEELPLVVASGRWAATAPLHRVEHTHVARLVARDIILRDDAYASVFRLGYERVDLIEGVEASVQPRAEVGRELGEGLLL